GQDRRLHYDCFRRDGRQRGLFCHIQLQPEQRSARGRRLLRSGISRWSRALPDADGYTHSDKHTYSDANGNGNPDRHGNSDFDADTNGHADTKAYSYSKGYSHAKKPTYAPAKT